MFLKQLFLSVIIKHNWQKRKRNMKIIPEKQYPHILSKLMTFLAVLFAQKTAHGFLIY